MKVIEVVGFFGDFLLGTIQPRLKFLVGWIGIDIRGVVGDKLSSYSDKVSSEVDDSVIFLDEAFVVADCDGLQTVTISYDESLIQEDDRVIDFRGNFVGIGTELVTNNSSYINPNPTYEELQSRLDSAQQEVTEKTNNLNNLQSQFDTLQTDYNAALADAAVTEAERNQLQNDLQQTQSDLDQANNDLQFAQTELTNLQAWRLVSSV